MKTADSRPARYFAIELVRVRPHIALCARVARAPQRIVKAFFSSCAKLKVAISYLELSTTQEKRQLSSFESNLFELNLIEFNQFGLILRGVILPHELKVD